jgi:uncharacterized delta-60 repeat protein
MKIQVLLTCAYFFFLTDVSIAQPGNLDLSFSSDGVVHGSLYEGLSCIALNNIILESGKVLITGGSNVPGNSYVGLIQRFLSDGGDDPGFSETGNVTLTLPGKPCYAINSIELPDGKILTLAGVNANLEDVIALFRIHPEGSPDETFGPNGMVIVDPGFTEQAPRYMVRQPDGKLVIGGYAKHKEDSFQKFMVVRCLPDGSMDKSFGENGFVTSEIGSGNAKIESLCLQADGKIVVAGNGVFNGKENIVVVRYKPDGTPDNSFHQDGMVNIAFQNDNFRAFRTLIQADGKIVVSGYIRSGNSDSDFVAARLNANGNPDTEFNEDGIARIAISSYADEARAMVIQEDGKIILAGYAHSNSPEGSNSALVRLTQEGYPDPLFGENGIVESDHNDHSNSLLGLTSQHDGKIVGVGRCYVGDFTKCLIARFTTGLTVSTSDPSLQPASVSVYPNPVMEEISIEYQLENEETISIRLVDLHGRVIENLLAPSNRQSGQHKETFAIDRGKSNGTYCIQIVTQNGVYAQKVILIQAS